MSPPRVTAVILDWAGTAVDHGSLAPVGVFVELFRRRGVHVSLAQAREPMGTHKREHIRRMCAMPELQAAWQAATGAAPTVADEEAMYEEAIPLQVACLPRFSDPIPGLLPAVALLRARGIRVGSTTGYTRPMLEVVRREAAARGYVPDCAVAADEVPEGRPAPFLCWEAARRLGAWPATAIVNVGDTVVDVQSGRNAGFWSVGVTLSGSLVGLDAAQLAALSPAERRARHDAAARILRDAGAHLVIQSVADLPRAVADIDERLGQP